MEMLFKNLFFYRSIQSKIQRILRICSVQKALEAEETLA